tara:strand:- start:4273 stop:4827 length:555 start_codon:yes stop_codon:yes gene_type:complete
MNNEIIQFLEEERRKEIMEALMINALAGSSVKYTSEQASINNDPTLPKSKSSEDQGFRISPSVSIHDLKGGIKKNDGVKESEIGVSGRVGVDASKSGYNFGGGVSGSFHRGAIKFPQHMQDKGAPKKVKYGTRGVDINDVDAYLNTPGGWNAKASYNPETNDKSIYLGKKINIDDVLKLFSKGR